MGVADYNAIFSCPLSKQIAGKAEHPVLQHRPFTLTLRKCKNVYYVVTVLLFIGITQQVY